MSQKEWGYWLFSFLLVQLYGMTDYEKEALKHIPKEGFLKTGSIVRPKLSGEQRTALIRKGNELFNNGDFEKAKRVFITAGYADGLSRMGDYYYEKNQPLEALKMYITAPAPDKKEKLIERMALTVRFWLNGGAGKNDE